MKKTLALCLLLCSSGAALAQSISPSTGAAGLTIDTTTITGGTAGRVLFESATNKLSEDAGLTYNPTTDALTLGANVTLLGEGADILAQRNGVNAQTSRVYNTFTDASNGEWLDINWITTPNTLRLGTNKNGTGQTRSLVLIQGGGIVARFDPTLNNTLLGIQALQSNTTGANNTANGLQALFSNTTGVNNTANGLQALFSNTTGANNTAVGLSALQSNTTGGSNTAVGLSALLFNTTGANNTASGFQALRSNTTGSPNTAVGVNALFSNTTGGDNTANGAFALQSNTTGVSNSAFGKGALFSNTTGINNTTIGRNALQSNTTGANNTANGLQALFDVGAAQTAGVFNVGTSYTIASVGTTDFTLIGAASNTVGVVFTATGVGAGTGTATPNATNSNTALGYDTGRGIIFGTNNTIVGAQVTGLAAGLTGAIILAQGDGTIKLDFGVTTAATWTSPVALKTLKITTATAATFHETSVALTDGAGVGSGTILNAPAAGNPTKWIGINDNGTTRYIPAW